MRVVKRVCIRIDPGEVHFALQIVIFYCSVFCDGEIARKQKHEIYGE